MNLSVVQNGEKKELVGSVKNVLADAVAIITRLKPGDCATFGETDSWGVTFDRVAYKRVNMTLYKPGGQSRVETVRYDAALASCSAVLGIVLNRLNPDGQP